MNVRKMLICIPTFSGPMRVSANLRSLEEKGYTTNNFFDILIIENPSTNQFDQAETHSYDNVFYSLNKQQIGLMGSWIKGVDYALNNHYRWCLFLGDDDTFGVNAHTFIDEISSYKYANADIIVMNTSVNGSLFHKSPIKSKADFPKQLTEIGDLEANFGFISNVVFYPTRQLLDNAILFRSISTTDCLHYHSLNVYCLLQGAIVRNCNMLHVEINSIKVEPLSGQDSLHQYLVHLDIGIAKYASFKIWLRVLVETRCLPLSDQYKQHLIMRHYNSMQLSFRKWLDCDCFLGYLRTIISLFLAFFSTGETAMLMILLVTLLPYKYYRALAKWAIYIPIL
jgi:hypothetical protein